MERVCVIGAGAIGSLFAGHLAAVADVSVLTRRDDHASALRREGLRISGRSERQASVHASADPAEIAPFDLGIVATKATIMTVLNGLGAEGAVRAAGDWPIISGVTFMSGTRHSDTHVEYVLDTETWIGPYEDTPFAAVQDAAALIASAGLKVEALPDLLPAQWSKLIFNATVNAVAALTGLPHDPHFAARERPTDLGSLVYDLIAEGKAVAAAAGIELHDDPWEMNVLATRRGSAHYPSMLEDVQARRRTEVDLITGALVREAERTGVPAPLHTALYRLIKAKEESYP